MSSICLGGFFWCIQELVRSKKLRDTPWGDPLLTAVEQRQEVYEATDRALDEVKASARHRTAMWQYVVLPCAQYYAALRSEYISRRVKTLRATMDGNLWHWLEACTDEQRREFHDEYVKKYGPPRFKVTHLALACKIQKDLSLSFCLHLSFVF
jgi:hypothetical protein